MDGALASVKEIDEEGVGDVDEIKKERTDNGGPMTAAAVEEEAFLEAYEDMMFKWAYRGL